MTVEQWHEVKRLFSKYVDAPADQRDHLLDKETGESAVRTEVERLFRHFDAASSGFMAPLGIEAPLLQPDACLANRFSIVLFLGRGGMGEVYEAIDGELREPVALKLIRPAGGSSEEHMARFRRELQLARRVTHPNVCRLYDIGREQFSWGVSEFLTMEFLRGETLAAVLKQREGFSPEEALPYARQILAGLQAVHEAGIVHRDLKPSNLMVIRQNFDPCRIVLMDFGLARAPDQRGDISITRSREVIGTLGYMAPEQLAGASVSTRTDLYAFGLILTEMLGSAADRGGDALPVPARWKDVIGSCLHPDPERRPSSAESVARQLENGIEYRQWMSRRTWIMAGATAAVAVAAQRWSSNPSPAFEPGSTLLVADASSPDGAAVAVQVRSVLRQSTRLSIWNHTRLAEVAVRMGKSATLGLAARDWREIAMRDSVRFLLFPSITQVGDGISLSLRLEQLEGSPDNAKLYWQESFEAADRTRLFDAIDRGGRWVRALIGEPNAEISNSSARPQAVTTPSWEALQEFSRGEMLASSHDREGALLAFGRAARIDSAFTMAWTRIGDIHASLGRDNYAFSAWRRAEEASRTRPLTRREDLRFRGMFASDCADYAEAEKLYREYRQYYPGEWYGSFYRALPLLMLGRAEEAIAELMRCTGSAVGLQAWLHLAVFHMYNQDQKAAEVSVTKLREANAVARAAFAEAVIEYAAGETDASLNALHRAAGDASLVPPAKAALSHAMILADGGRTGEAAETLRASAKDDDRDGERDHWAEKRINLSMLLDRQGDRTAAEQVLEELRRVDLGPENTGWAGVLFARFGQRSDAENKLASIPPDLPYPRFQIPRLHIEAELQFASGKRAEGLRLARQAAKLEPAGFGSAYLGESLERAGYLTEAFTEDRDYFRAKSLQLFLAFPDPAGSWYRATQAATRLKTQLIN